MQLMRKRREKICKIYLMSKMMRLKWLSIFSISLAQVPFFDLVSLLKIIGTIDAKNLKVVLRALGFDPSNEEIIQLIKDLGKEDAKYDVSKIDF